MKLFWLANLILLFSLAPAFANAGKKADEEQGGNDGKNRGPFHVYKNKKEKSILDTRYRILDAAQILNSFLILEMLSSIPYPGSFNIIPC